MNIFYLDSNVKKIAEYHCDKHLVKMITETAQLLCTSYYYTNEEELSPYKLSHSNHPCSKWVRKSLDNWLWLHNLGLELYKEYQYRYDNRPHKAGEVIVNLKYPSLGLGRFTEPPSVTDSFLDKSTIENYRDYYKFKSDVFEFRYTRRIKPKFL